MFIMDANQTYTVKGLGNKSLRIYQATMRNPMEGKTMAIDLYNDSWTDLLDAIFTELDTSPAGNLSCDDAIQLSLSQI